MERLQTLAKNFLDIADFFNVQVSCYLNGSNNPYYEECYWKVIEANAAFIKEYNAYFEENHRPGLDYTLAESVFPYDI